MVKHTVAVTLTSRLIKKIDEESEAYFGGNRSITVEYYLWRGLTQRAGDISVTREEK